MYCLIMSILKLRQFPQKVEMSSLEEEQFYQKNIVFKFVILVGCVKQFDMWYWKGERIKPWKSKISNNNGKVHTKVSWSLMSYNGRACWVYILFDVYNFKHCSGQLVRRERYEYTISSKRYENVYTN